MRIVFIDDILYHDLDYKQKKVMPYQKIFLPIIKSSIDNNIEITFDLINEKYQLFSRKFFYELGNNPLTKSRYNDYNIEDFNEKQLEYLESFFHKGDIIIGFELYEKFSKLLTSFGCKIIDFAYHPYKLFDDLAFGVYTNDKNIYNELIKYQIPEEKFYYYANYWKIFMGYENIIQDEDLEDNSCLFIGQTLIDKSIDNNGQFLNVTHFGDKLKELSKQYSKIYYLPHPYLGKKRKVIYDWVNKSPYIELLKNRSTYGLLASDKIKKVIGISTSVLYEAKYFKKEIEYLFKPLFNVDVAFEENCYISIFEDYWNPKFWADILSPVCKINPIVKNVNHFKGSTNKLRNIGNMYWGYAQLDPVKRIPNIEESVKNLYTQYIAPLH